MDAVLILSYSDVSRDPRVSKQIQALTNHFHVDLAAYGDAVSGIRSFFPIHTKPKFSAVRKAKRATFKLTKDYDGWYWDAARTDFLAKVDGAHYKVILANDIHTLPLALKLAGSERKVVFDAHEYHPDEFSDQEDWAAFNQPYITYLCKKYIPEVASFITVNEPIAELYRELTGTESEVVFNTANFHSLSVRKTNPEAVRIIHHGVALRSRSIEDMIVAMGEVPGNYSLDLMLTGGLDASYYQELGNMVSTMDNVRLIAPVPLQEIVGKLHEYDIGLFMLPEVNTNYRLALPNKLFEFVQARLAVITTPNIEMKRFIETHGIGETSRGFSVSDLVETLCGLTVEDIDRYKQCSDDISSQYSSEEAMKQYLAIVAAVANNVA